MAFRDENGKITIDEIVAQGDIRKLLAALEGLTKTLEYIRQVKEEAAEFSGNTGTAIIESSHQLLAQLHTLEKEIREAIDEIERTVSKYKTIDANLRGVITDFGSQEEN